VHVPITIDHDSAEFPFQQLARALRDGIESGEYPPGRKMPSIDAIVKETGLSPMTIRRAFQVLAAEGHVTVVPGRGTYVVPQDR
jgi:GntR family transcriptional regulator